MHARLILYKRIAGEPSEDGLRELEVEMIDRFGPLPPPAKTLLRITARKLRAAPLGIRKIDLGGAGGRVTFGETAAVDPARVVALLQSHPRRFGFDGERRIRVRWELPDLDARLDAIDHIVAEARRPPGSGMKPARSPFGAPLALVAGLAWLAAAHPAAAATPWYHVEAVLFAQGGDSPWDRDNWREGGSAAPRGEHGRAARRPRPPPIKQPTRHAATRSGRCPRRRSTSRR